MRPLALPALRPLTAAVLLWVGLVLVVENFVGHIGDTWSFRGWPFVWQSSLPHGAGRTHIPALLFNLAVCCWAFWSTARLTESAVREWWRFSLGSLLLFTAAIAVTLGIARAGAPDDVLHPSFPLRVLEPRSAWGFGWEGPGVIWMVNAALLLAMFAGCWMLLQAALTAVRSLTQRAPAPTPASD